MKLLLYTCTCLLLLISTAQAATDLHAEVRQFESKVNALVKAFDHDAQIFVDVNLGEMTSVELPGLPVSIDQNKQRFKGNQIIGLTVTVITSQEELHPDVISNINKFAKKIEIKNNPEIKVIKSPSPVDKAQPNNEDGKGLTPELKLFPNITKSEFSEIMLYGGLVLCTASFQCLI